ncbi:AzlD domain-containing protein [Capillibacterium thermochitinicola]|uniref:AzlD domain-containing protein n=1 Tax=Capillibacterium thermochitinicola TaxID=2699427 RepID=A0A8J6HXN5_9FIRM|nr:AzlD domain-containing protein [Capillibacterium thermochitinicola]MBA2133362.1 AzlD domain-containing protein [Capillibacterium thermochitinicola]NLW60467.1 AzlD domain-containing protein [Bacillota bacterium]
MQNSQDLLLVLGMAAVTYLPRLLPMLLLSTDKLPPVLKRFFDFVPYAVLTTLIFPEILFSTAQPASAAVGGVIAFSLAYGGKNLFLVVTGGIGGVFLWELLF